MVYFLWVIFMQEKMYLIDLDGTMYRGDTICEGAKEFIDYLIENNKPFLFLTNNARRTGQMNVEQMTKMGFTNIEPKHFFTSSMAAAAYIDKIDPTHKRCAYIGEAGLKEALENKGFQIVDKDVQYVFVGLDIHATYMDYSRALTHLLKGAKLVGTNSDRKIPKDDGFNCGNGSIVAMFEYASGQESAKIGKPYAPILEACLQYCGKSKAECAIIGDNLETDIKLGVDNGVETIFITSGVHTEEDIERLNIKPTKIIHNLMELIK